MLLTVGIGLLAAAIFAAVFAVAGGDREHAGVQRSLAAIERGHGAVFETPADRSFSERMGVPLLKQLGGLGRALTRAGAMARLQRQLDYAGNPAGWTVERAVAVKGIGLVLAPIGVAVLAMALFGGRALPLSLVLGAVLGFFAPELWLYNVGAKRQNEIRKTLPDVLDTLTIGVEAGQGFDAALAQVARNGKGPLVGETARVLQEMRIGMSRVQALRAMATRTTVPELRGFASAIVQASELGVPVGKVLREQANQMRLRRRQYAEEKAQKIPIKILFPTLFCLFPALFVVILGPGVLSLMKAF
jgi:tight adherence protein C